MREALIQQTGSDAATRRSFLQGQLLDAGKAIPARWHTENQAKASFPLPNGEHG